VLLPTHGEASRKLTIQGSGDAWSEVLVRVVRVGDGAQHSGWIATAIDITEVQQVRQTHAVHLRALDVSADGIAIVDVTAADAPMTYANHALQQISGYRMEELLGHNCRILQGNDRSQPEISAMRQAIADRKPIAVTLRNYRKNGEMFWNELRMAPVLDESGMATHYVGTMRDVSYLRKVTADLEQIALHDPLTKVLNRTGFRTLLKTRLLELGSARLAVIKLNAAGFHGINTTFGYHTGDALLIQIAERLGKLPNTMMARIDADNFVMGIPIEPGQTGAQVADAVQAELAPSFVLPGVSLRVFFHIGFTVGSSTDTVFKLMRQAAAALHEARRARARVPHHYTADLDREISRRIRLTGDLQQAVSDGDLVVHYQPKVELDTGRIAGAEGLIRWQHPTFGLQLPGRFIPTAEHTGLIVPIGEWAMRAIASYAADVNRNLGKPYRFAINVSQMQFRQIDLPKLVEQVLLDTGADPSWITLELTESVFADESAATGGALRRLRDMGLGLSIDDFGTEYSSLRYLGAFPITEIKIDRTFVKDMQGSQPKRAVVDAVVRLGRAMEVDVVAEGIETAAEWQILQDVGCRYGQGYYFSMPMTGEDFKWLADSQAILPMGPETPLVLEDSHTAHGAA
jgi:PAS domain S-box-containing protein/diguanylate cyclase (GGDEF)-like protein